MLKKIQEVIQQYREEQENIDPPSMPVEGPEHAIHEFENLLKSVAR